jgi:hypothetical protein
VNCRPESASTVLNRYVHIVTGSIESIAMNVKAIAAEISVPEMSVRGKSRKSGVVIKMSGKMIVARIVKSEKKTGRNISSMDMDGIDCC